MKGLKKTITIIGIIILLVGLFFLGKKANEKDGANRQNDYKERVAAKQQSEPPAPLLRRDRMGKGPPLLER